MDTLVEGRRIWEVVRRQLIGRVENALDDRLRKTVAAEYDPDRTVLTLDGVLLADDLDPRSLAAEAVTVATGGRPLELRQVGGARPSRLKRREQTSGDASSAPPEPPAAPQPNDAAERRAQFEQRLSAEDRALLEELERKRVAHAEQAVVPVASDQVEMAETEQLRPGRADAEIAERQDVAEAPRRRLRKEPAVA